jgi:hypothetical protein
LAGRAGCTADVSGKTERGAALRARLADAVAFRKANPDAPVRQWSEAELSNIAGQDSIARMVVEAIHARRAARP